MQTLSRMTLAERQILVAGTLRVPSATISRTHPRLAVRHFVPLALSRVIRCAAIAALVLGGERAGHGASISSPETDLVTAERKLEAARARVTLTAEQLAAVGSLRTAREWVFRASRATHDAVDRVRKEAEKAEAVVSSDAAAAEQRAGEARLAAEARRLEMERTRDRFLNQSLVAYDLSQHGRLTVNAMTGAIDLSLDMGPGIKLGSGDLDALLLGKFRLPDVDPLELACETYVNHDRLKSNYVEVQAGLAAEHGAANVYLLSRRFLEWATPERLSGDFARSILKAGGSVERELALARRQIQLEYEDIAAWLRKKGVKDLGPDPCGVLVELIRAGSYPRLGLSLMTRPVAFTHRSGPAGQTDVPLDLLKRMRPKGLPGQRPAREITENRPALVIVWTGPTEGHESLAAGLESGFQFSAPEIDELPKHLPTKTDPRARRLIAWIAPHGLFDIDASVGPRRLALAALGVKKEEIDSDTVGNHVIVDMRQSQSGKIVASFVSQLALGNSKFSEVDLLELDRSSGRLEAEFTLHHRHVWPSLREAQAKLRTAAVTGAPELADRLTDAAFSTARTRFQEADSTANEASAKARDAQKKAREAADHVATKRREVASLASDLARAQTDLRAATELEALARKEAQSACALMLELDATVRRARDNLRSSVSPLPREINHPRKP
jgi:hypothetical protein